MVTTRSSAMAGTTGSTAARARTRSTATTVTTGSAAGGATTCWTAARARTAAPARRRTAANEPATLRARPGGDALLRGPRGRVDGAGRARGGGELDGRRQDRLRD